MNTKHNIGWRRWLVAVLFFVVNIVTMATSRPTLLVINSDDEGEPWANDMAIPITMFIATIDSVGCDIVNLDNALICDSATYHRMVDHVFEQYKGHEHPKYVVMVGNFAFTLRDRIKQEWGDIPMLLLSRISTFSSDDENLCYHTEPVTEEHGTPLQSVRDDYNFTAIIMPDRYKENVDLMVKLNPQMKELVYLSTCTYVSRRGAGIVDSYLKEQYPDIKFTWLQAAQENSEYFQDYMANRNMEKSFLIASWVYEKKGTRGFETLTCNDLRLLPSSKNPIFAMRESYLKLGGIGGVYCDNNAVKENCIKVVREMIKGTSMRSIPFYKAEQNIITKINYALAEEYGLNVNVCPEDTLFFNKPSTYWERYMWQTIVIILVAALFFSLMWWKIAEQKTKLDHARYNEYFMNNMPVPYAKAEIRYNGQGRVQNIVYNNKNEAFARLIEKNSIPGNPFLLFPADFIAEKTEQLLKTSQKVLFNYHFEKTDTWYNFILCSVASSKGDHGGILTVVDVFASDLTERMKLEKRLHLTVRKLNLALTVSYTVPWQWNLQTGIIVFDDLFLLGRTLSRKVQFNDGYEEWQITYDDLLKRIYSEDRHMITKLHQDFVSGAIRDCNMQMRMYKEMHSDEIDWVQIYSAVTDSTDDGSSLIVTGTLRIITAQKQQEEDMTHAKERAEESDRMKSSFLANMSHEIRTPLNAIVGFSNLIADAESDEERAEFKEIINTNTDLLLTLINDVLDLAKIESNTIDINFTAVDINAVLQSVERSTKLRLNPGVRFNMVLGLDKCVAETDPTRLSQILINLLTNACKFTEQGSITFGYELRGQNTLYFYVSDTGIGLSKEGRQKVFERFVKLNNFAQGTGLGLSISKRLVEMLGGEIGVESAGEGCGSRFWFTLPYAPVVEEKMEEKAMGAHLLSDDGMTKCVNNVNIADENKPLVLVAEDHESNYHLIVHLMKGRYRLIRAIDGEKAVTLCQKHNPSLILMDINMPVMNGYEAVERIRETNKTVPIIAVTAYAYASDRIKIMNSGFDGYVSKPVSQKALANVLENIKNGGGKTTRPNINQDRNPI